MARPTPLGYGLLVVLQLIACLRQALAADVTATFPVVQITSGQQLVSELVRVYSTGQNATLQLPPGITSLAGFQPANNIKTVSSGWAHITGASSGDSVLDVANLQYIANSGLTLDAHLNLSNAWFINLCSGSLTLARDAQFGYTVFPAANLYAFGELPVTRLWTLSNTTLLLSQDELNYRHYRNVLTLSTLPRIKYFASVVAPAFVGQATTIGEVSPYSLQELFVAKAASWNYNTWSHSSSDPALPPALRTRAAGGTLMQAQFCNGTLIDESLPQSRTWPDNRPERIPFWAADTDASLRASIVSAAAYIRQSNLARDQFAPAVVQVMANTSLTGFTTSTISADGLIMHGIYAQGKDVTLDLANHTNTFMLALGSRMYLERLVLRNLPTERLDGLGGSDAEAESYVSALPLWSFNILSRASTDSVVQLANVTLSLPTSDYLAILSAALKGAAWQSGAVTTKPLMAGITVFNLAQAPSRTAPYLSFSAFQGWGWNCSGLILMPESPLSPDAYATLPDDPQGDTGVSDSASTRSAVGIGVGVGVGGALVAGMLAVLFWHAKQKKKQYAADSPGGFAKSSCLSEDEEKGTLNPCHPQPSSKKSVDVSADIKPPSAASGWEHKVHHPQSVTHSSAEGNIIGHQPKYPSGGIFARMSAGAGGSGSQGAFDPNEAVKLVSGTISGDGDKVLVQAVIGKGAWGTVYRGKWRGLDVAVKTVTVSNNAGLPLERAIAEAAVCLSVVHPNIVATYHHDISKTETVVTDARIQVQVEEDAVPQELKQEYRLLLIQEWCNTNLRAVIQGGLLHNKETGAPQMDCVLALALQVMQGLQYLHERKVIHGDLKPENVLVKVDPTCEIGVVCKITDFGLSQTLEPQKTHISNYRSGTPFYVSPEVASQGRAKPVSDVYSLGVVLWEMYHRSPPWVRDAEGAFHLDPRFPNFPPECPPAFSRLVGRCLLSDPLSRATLQEVMAAAQAMHEAWLEGWDMLERPAGYEGPAPDDSDTGDSDSEQAADHQALMLANLKAAAAAAAAVKGQALGPGLPGGVGGGMMAAGHAVAPHWYGAGGAAAPAAMAAAPNGSPAPLAVLQAQGVQTPGQELSAAAQQQHAQPLGSPSFGAGSLGALLLAQPATQVQMPAGGQPSQPASALRSRAHVAAPPLVAFVASQV